MCSTSGKYCRGEGRAGGGKGCNDEEAVKGLNLRLPLPTKPERVASPTSSKKQ